MNRISQAMIIAVSLLSFGISSIVLNPIQAGTMAQTKPPARSDDLTELLGQPTLPNDLKDPTIVNLVKTSEQRQDFRYFVQAIKATGLDQMLANEGPFTVFAPTNLAFESLPASTLKALIRPENRALLAQILKYHIITGRVSSDALQNGPLPSLAGSNLFFQTSNGRVIVNNSRVVQPDINASNGFIHGINQVLIPSSLRQQMQSLAKSNL